MFLAVCLLRTPVQRRQTAEMMETVAATLLTQGFTLDPEAAQRALADSEFTREEIEELRTQLFDGLGSGRMTVEFPRNVLIKQFLQGAIAAAWTIFILEWTVARLPDDGPRQPRSFPSDDRHSASEAANDLEGEWAEGQPTPESIRELNLRSYATGERFIFGSQQAVTQVHSLRRTESA
jgi:hypothetical protein